MTQNPISIPLPPDDSAARFMQLFLAHQRQIYAFILSLIGNAADSDDVLQETNLAMWRDFASFDATETGDAAAPNAFVAWGLSIARHRVLQYFDRRRVDRRRFSPQTLDALGAELAACPNAANAVHEALDECLAALPRDEHDMVRSRYVEQTSAEQVARRLGLSVFTFYKKLAAVRAKLLGCIRRKVQLDRTGGDR